MICYVYFKRLAGRVRKLRADVSGASSIEYVLLAALIALVLVAVLQVMGISITDIFDFANDAMDDASS